MTFSLMFLSLGVVSFPMVMELHTPPYALQPGELPQCDGRFDGGMDLDAGLWEIQQIVDCNGEIQRYVYGGVLEMKDGTLGGLVARHSDGRLAFACEVGEGADVLCGAEEGEIYLPEAMLFSLRGAGVAWFSQEMAP